MSQGTPIRLQGILIPQFDACPERVIGQKGVMDLAKTLVNLVGNHAFATFSENPGQSKRPSTYLDEHHVLI
jgi:tRNA U38,U39,U40 pseudouridine synthase TruA